jgi:hypothetical protein
MVAFCGVLEVAPKVPPNRASNKIAEIPKEWKKDHMRNAIRFDRPLCGLRHVSIYGT